MVDETTNKSNNEQLTLVIRWVNNDFTVAEDFLGLYNLSAIDAQSIMQAMKDVFLRFQIPFAKLRGQCYTDAILLLEQGQGLLLRSKT